MNAAQSAHLALLCKGRRLELAQWLYYAKQSAPHSSDIAKWQLELELNQSCIDLLEPSSAVRAA